MQDPSAVEASIREVLGSDGNSNGPATPLPDILWAPHTEVRCCTFVDKESSSPTLTVAFKYEREAFVAARHVVDQIAVRSYQNSSF